MVPVPACYFLFIYFLTSTCKVQGVVTPADITQLVTEAEELYREAEEAVKNPCTLQTLNDYSTDLTRISARIEGVTASVRTSVPPHRPPAEVIANIENSMHLLHSKITELLEQVRGEIESSQERACYAPPRLYGGQRGRPKFNVTRDQIDLLGCEAGLTWAETARTLGISRSSLYRRRKEYGLTAPRTTVISDDDLDSIVRKVTAGRPHMGVTMTQAALHTQSIRVPKARVQTSLKRIDPHGATFRMRSKIKRIRYFSPSPNFLWHIDSNHKLAG
ncbi:uncharacterized protein LOC144872283 [Branchiostoma floridae x Branchiostoma japonicum]